MEPTSNSPKMHNKGIIIALIVVVLVAGLAYIFVISPKKDQVLVDNPIVTTPETTGGTTTSTTTSGGVTQNVYKDGVYTALGDYNSPGGAEQIKITLTLKNDIITDAVAVPQATRPNSVVFQRQFAAGFKALIVGKNIDTVSLHKVSGSSLTPNGFNDAVAKIKVQAKA